MKKTIAALLLLIAVSLPTLARDSYAHDAAVLPTAAQTVVKNNFKSGVSFVKIDRELGRVSEYEVVLQDGSEITFDSKGNWKDIETSLQREVPASFIPKPIAGYVKKVQPGTRIVGIERDRRGYDVQLSNGVEMRFTRSGEFAGYDD